MVLFVMSLPVHDIFVCFDGRELEKQQLYIYERSAECLERLLQRKLFIQPKVEGKEIFSIIFYQALLYYTL